MTGAIFLLKLEGGVALRFSTLFEDPVRSLFKTSVEVLFRIQSKFEGQIWVRDLSLEIESNS